MKIRIASRKSDLAQIQARQVAQKLMAEHTNLSVEFFFKESLGDKNLTDPLWKMPEKGVFTADFHDDLVKGHCDLVVHSWKDLPTAELAETHIAATLPRADARDILLIRKDSLDVPELRLLSSSPRRAHNIAAVLKWALPRQYQRFEFISVRGNVPTRLKKLMESSAHGLIVAKAALDRLLLSTYPEHQSSKEQIKSQLESCLFCVLPIEANPPAAAQGALAIEILRSRSDLFSLLQKINCSSTFKAVSKEREIFSAFGGGCHQKLGVHVRDHDELGMVLSVAGEDPSGNELKRHEVIAPKSLSKIFRPEQSWPLERDEFFFFERVSVDCKAPSADIGLFVSRANALPAQWKIPHEQLVWTSGLKTWAQLAERGVWVNGSCESMGEEIPNLNWTPQKWVKLGHSDMPSGGTFSETLCTYKLSPKEIDFSFLKSKRNFFWMSASSFSRALQLVPEIITAQHACGPGNTLKLIREYLKGRGHVRAYLNYRSWLSESISSS